MAGIQVMRPFCTVVTFGWLVWSSSLFAADSATAPRPIPMSRPELKDLLEDLKQRTPRIPLPELSAEEKQKLGNRAGDYEYRLRYHYMPPGDGRTSQFSRGVDSNMSLDYPFKTMMFWIVSRMNNCQYCLGHQEIKLSVAGLDEDRIAALDGDWSEFSAKEQAAFGFARKLTYEPHLLADADIEKLREHFSDLQILEIVLSVAGNNSINRWKEGVGVPQSQNGRGFLRRGGGESTKERIMPIETFLTPTADKYKESISKIAPLHRDESTGRLTSAAISRRPPLESRAEVERQLELCRTRQSRLPVLSEAQAQSVMADAWSSKSSPQWLRLMANFPREGASRVRSLVAAEESGDLDARLKAQVSWIIARQDRAWYATAEARRRLKKLDISDERIYALDGSWEEFSPKERALFLVARKLAASPILLTDQEVTAAVKDASPREVVQLISYVTGRAYFNRVTEAAGLPADE
jgi:alkylhydroperoxidase family enzyme